MNSLMASTIIITSLWQLMLLWSLVATLTMGVSGAPPTAANLARCSTTCGNINISYPFGMEPGCFRPGFELTCNHTTEPAKLFLGNTTAEVIDQDFYGDLSAFIIFNIATTPGVHTYNLSWESPGNNFYIYADNKLVIIGCGIEVYMFDPDTNDGAVLGYCESWCADIVAILKEANEGYCNGMGCCTILFPRIVRGFRVTIIQKEETEAQRFVFANATIKAFLSYDSYDSYEFSVSDLLSNKINMSSIGATKSYLATVITDPPNCQRAKLDPKQYACDNECIDWENKGYYCTCSNKFYAGNPYLLDGCNPDYNSTTEVNCFRSCGNTTIPFPFGLEPGCFANEKFQLNCTSNIALIGEPPEQYQVTNISLDEGLLFVSKFSNHSDAKGPQSKSSVDGHDNTEFIEQYGILMWTINNITCEMVKDKPTYACVSANSECIRVADKQSYNGYRCKCLAGFGGNPYLLNGCEDINECLMPGYCNGKCHNLNGSYKCIGCPHGTSFDIIKAQCTSTKHRNLLLGAAIGLSCGFGVLALTLSTTVLVRKWKRGVQRKTRRAYFRKNKGLLLEQLISSNESVAHNTKIFSLEELENATNNFDSTRILGHGGHGTVYKGILSDQRVVAIKKSKIIEQSEIDQFVNEVAILSQIIHRNVVKLFGCCLESEVPLLVYEFISNGTLYDLFHGDSSVKCLLTWDDRIKIALQVAGALAYLHSAASIPIFHRDVKSANILLDNNFTAKISDFGTSKSVSIDETHVVTIVQGTFGYLDPEYYHIGQLTEKSDVYSFGVILLELLTRKKPIFLNSFGAKQSLCHYFLQSLSEKTTLEIVDAQVAEEASQGEIDEMATLSEMCLRLRGEERPTMKEVELKLQLLKAKRAKIYQEDLQRDIEIKALLPSQSNSTSQTHYTEFDAVANRSSQAVSQCYTLEQELVSWTKFPR